MHGLYMGIIHLHESPACSFKSPFDKHTLNDCFPLGTVAQELGDDFCKSIFWVLRATSCPSELLNSHRLITALDSAYIPECSFDFLKAVLTGIKTIWLTVWFPDL